MNAMTIVGQPDGDLLETSTLVGCVVHGPTRTLVRKSTLAARESGWALFGRPTPRPVTKAYWQSKAFTLAGVSLALRMKL